MRRRFEVNTNTIKIPSKNGIYYFLKDGKSVDGVDSLSPQELAKNGEGVLCVYKEKHVLILPTQDHPSANWGRSGDLTEGVTTFKSIPNIYYSKEAFYGEQDNVNFLNKYGGVADYGFYKASSGYISIRNQKRKNTICRRISSYGGCIKGRYYSY